MKLHAVQCAHCGAQVMKPLGHINRARKGGYALYCNRSCGGLARRVPLTAAEKAEKKALYDAAYRLRDIEARKAKKHAYHKRAYDPAKAAIERKAKMPRHVEYCRRPEYRAQKSVYDLSLRASEYGDFAESWRLLLELEKEIRSRATAYERRVANGYYTRNAQKRRRDLCLTRRKTS